MSEMIFTQAIIGGGGVTSMTLNPTKGEIIECDVIWSVGPNAPVQWPTRLNQVGCASVAPCLKGGPAWTTAIPHEIGHFFGLDHTNLHPGHAPGGTSACTPALGPGNAPAVNGAPASLASFGSFMVYPEMVAIISWVNYWRCDPTWASSGQPDDASGMAEIYPVAAPSAQGTTPQALPAINAYGRIEGSVSFNPSPGVSKVVFGANILPIPINGGVPTVGKVSGTGRITPNIGVVGATDTSTGVATSGEFRVERVGGGASAAGKAVRILVEPLDSLGMSSVPTGNPFPFSEWFYDPTYNPNMNIMACPMLQHTLMPNGAFPLYTGTLPPPAGASLGSLFLGPGTVLQVSLNMSNGVNFAEPVSRPVVMIDQRLGRTVPYSSFQPIVATVYHDYELDTTTGLWSVNGGTPFAMGAMVTNQGTPTAPGPYTTTWSTTVGALGIGSTGTVVLRFSASEFPTTPGNAARPPAGITAKIGINEVVF